MITSNDDALNADPTHPSEIIEFTRSGKFIGEFNIDAAPDGAFGVATVLPGEAPFNFAPAPPDDAPFNFAAVDDNPNTVTVYRTRH